jgi:hypothetical protein
VGADGGELRAAGMRRLARFARPRPRGALRRDAARESEAMHLADDRVARDAVTETAGDLAGAQPLVPQFLQNLYPILGPGQFVVVGGLI